MLRGRIQGELSAAEFEPSKVRIDRLLPALDDELGYSTRNRQAEVGGSDQGFEWPTIERFAAVVGKNFILYLSDRRHQVVARRQDEFVADFDAERLDVVHLCAALHVRTGQELVESRLHAARDDIGNLVEIFLLRHG